MQYVMKLPFLDKPHDTFRLFVCAAVRIGRTVHTVRYGTLAKVILGATRSWDAQNAKSAKNACQDQASPRHHNGSYINRTLHGVNGPTKDMERMHLSLSQSRVSLPYQIRSLFLSSEQAPPAGWIRPSIESQTKGSYSANFLVLVHPVRLAVYTRILCFPNLETPELPSISLPPHHPDPAILLLFTPNGLDSQPWPPRYVFEWSNFTSAAGMPSCR